MQLFCINGKEKNKMKIAEMRELLGVSRAKFSREYGIPVRTLENWESGKSNCPEYVKKLLERAVRVDSKKMHTRDGGKRIMYRTGEWVSHRKIVKLGQEIKTIDTSRGAMYTLYKEYAGSRYFADVSEGFGEVEQVVAGSEDEAIKIFEGWMQALEEDVVQKYHIIDADERDAASEKEYTFEQVKAFFEPDADELPGYHEKWEEVEDLDDLEEYLEWESAGMRQHWKVEEVQ